MTEEEFLNITADSLLITKHLNILKNNLKQDLKNKKITEEYYNGAISVIDHGLRYFLLDYYLSQFEFDMEFLEIDYKKDKGRTISKDFYNSAKEYSEKCQKIIKDLYHIS